MCVLRVFTFSFAVRSVFFFLTARLCNVMISGLFRRCSALVLPPLRLFLFSKIFSFLSVRPAMMLARRWAFVRPFDGAAFSSAALTASGMRPGMPRSPSLTSASESSESASEPEPTELMSSSLRFLPSCLSMDFCSRSFCSCLKSSALSTFSVSICLPLAILSAVPSAPSAPSPFLTLTSISMPSTRSTASPMPKRGACTSPRVIAIVASRPRSERCSSCGCSSR
mmetsp:Transcript_90157/g.232719  ORF Transcript_90157/g.232719 Transcript_90157/m.232719 type:complete len:225 (+) Transcript_90157:56-730(+)